MIEFCGNGFIFKNMPLWTLLTAVGAVGALYFYGIQQLQNKRANRANFWLKLKELFAEKDRFEIHKKIMDNHLEFPISEHDSAIIDDYLGLFEICMEMLDQKVIDLNTFTSIYKYRLDYILRNELLVKEKLIKEGHWFGKLYKLYSLISKSQEWNKFWTKEIFDKKSENLDYERIYRDLRSNLIDKFLSKEPCQ